MIITLFYTFLVLAVLAVLVGGVVQYRRARNTDYAVLYRREYRARRLAESGLRKIASGSTGNPVLEAQLVLDDIENQNMKEITS